MIHPLEMGTKRLYTTTSHDRLLPITYPDAMRSPLHPRIHAHTAEGAEETAVVPLRYADFYEQEERVFMSTSQSIQYTPLFIQPGRTS